jgi:hypothetical protein
MFNTIIKTGGLIMNEMNNHISRNRAALLAGIALVLMAAAAGYAYGFVISAINAASGDGNQMSDLIINSEALFRSGIFGFLVILILDLVVTWALYYYFKTIAPGLSLLTAWARLIYTSMLGVSISFLITALVAATGAGSGNTLVPLMMKAFDETWSAGLIVFGLHLLLLGFLSLQDKNIHFIFAILLFIAAAGYLVVNSANLLVPGFEAYKGSFEAVLAAPMAIGELALAILLIVKGIRGHNYKRRLNPVVEK